VAPDHTVDGVAATSAHPNHLDTRLHVVVVRAHGTHGRLHTSHRPHGGRRRPLGVRAQAAITAQRRVTWRCQHRPRRALSSHALAPRQPRADPARQRLSAALGRGRGAACVQAYEHPPPTASAAWSLRAQEPRGCTKTITGSVLLGEIDTRERGISGATRVVTASSSPQHRTRSCRPPSLRPSG